MGKKIWNSSIVYSDLLLSKVGRCLLLHAWVYVQSFGSFRAQSIKLDYSLYIITSKPPALLIEQRVEVEVGVIGIVVAAVVAVVVVVVTAASLHAVEVGQIHEVFESVSVLAGAL